MPDRKRSVPVRGIAFLAIAGAGLSLFVDVSAAQPPAASPAPRAAARSAAAPAFQVHATLAQLMKGILFPSSNVVFAAQGENPADAKPAADPSLATNPLASTYGKWEAVENASLALTEAANLLVLPGRKCSNGRAVPLQNADWPKFVQGLRDAGSMAYKAAQSKNQDNILMAADAMSTACGNCHDKYREKANLADRCK
jgi:cytochrome c556